MIKVKNGQDPYSVIGQYIRSHVSAIEDMIAVIEIDGKTSNELFTVDMTVDGYFIWENDWYEGGENVVLIDFFPVSDACNPKNYWIPCSDHVPKKYGNYFITEMPIGDFGVEPYVATYDPDDDEWTTDSPFKIVRRPVIAWMPLPEPYKAEEEGEGAKLKPCPFCGNKNPQTVVDNETETKFGVCCFECGAQISATFEERDEAEAAWNRRAQPEQKKGRWVSRDYNKRCGNVVTTLYYFPNCSECGHSGDYNMSFCPNCGAKMEE